MICLRGIPMAEAVRSVRSRISIAVTLAVVVMGAGAALAEAAPEGAALDALEARLVARSGTALDLIEDGASDLPPFVFYAPLAALWFLGTDSLETADIAPVTGSATLLRAAGEDGDLIRLLWPDGGITDLAPPKSPPELAGAGTPHPLALKHDRLLGEALAISVAGLPPGSRFGADGLVRAPGAPERVSLWSSHGDSVVIEHPDGSLVGVALEDLMAALGPQGEGRP